MSCKMIKIEQLEKRLLDAGRDAAVDDTVPVAFERRVMARIHQMGSGDVWSAWSAALWRGLAPCLGVAILLVVWSAMSLRDSGEAPFASELEATLYAPVASVDTDLW